MSDGPCEYDDDAAGWVLGALSPLEAERIAAHLESCASCRAEVTKLTEAAERLGDVVPLSTPLPELRERVMASVRAEASLFKVADADAAPPERSLPPRRSRRNAGVLAAIFASLAAGVAAIVLVAADHGSPTASPRTVAGKVTSEGGSGARALVRTGPHAGTLIVTRLAAPPAGRVYQAWIIRRGSPATPTGALFSVPASGDTQVLLPSLHAVAEVIVTAEPPRGSPTPTLPPIVLVQLTARPGPTALHS